MGKKVLITVSENEGFVLLNIHTCLPLEVCCANISSKGDRVLHFPNLEIDLYHREIIQNGRIKRLTDIEFRLLHYLANQPGRVFTYQQIYEGVWGEEYIYEKGIIMSHIRHIRQKLESEGDSYDYIENIRGVGYRFKRVVTDSS